MQACFHNNKEGIVDDVFELCSGTANVSVILIRRPTMLVPTSTLWLALILHIYNMCKNFGDTSEHADQSVVSWHHLALG
eukprot:12934593-Prorocentrum_lima.AAC.1